MTDIPQQPARNPSPKSLQSARNYSDLMALWALCEQRTCRKLGRCRAVPLTCLRDCMDLVPQGAGAFVLALFDGKDQGLGFDDAIARVPDDLCREHSIWHQAVTRMTGRRSMERPASARPKPGAPA